MELELLAEALVNRLLEIAPTAFQVFVGPHAETIEYRQESFEAETASWFRSNYEAHLSDETPREIPQNERDAALKICIQVFDEFQDFVAEGTGEPWPNSGRNVLPKVRGLIVDDAVTIWFEGSVPTPIRMSPIRFDQLIA